MRQEGAETLRRVDKMNDVLATLQSELATVSDNITTDTGKHAALKYLTRMLRSEFEENKEHMKQKFQQVVNTLQETRIKQVNMQKMVDTLNVSTNGLQKEIDQAKVQSINVKKQSTDMIDRHVKKLTQNDERLQQKLEVIVQNITHQKLVMTLKGEKTKTKHSEISQRDQQRDTDIRKLFDKIDTCQLGQDTTNDAISIIATQIRNMSGDITYVSDTIKSTVKRVDKVESQLPYELNKMSNVEIIRLQENLRTEMLIINQSLSALSERSDYNCNITAAMKDMQRDSYQQLNVRVVILNETLQNHINTFNSQPLSYETTQKTTEETFSSGYSEIATTESNQPTIANQVLEYPRSTLSDTTSNEHTTTTQSTIHSTTNKTQPAMTSTYYSLSEVGSGDETGTPFISEVITTTKSPKSTTMSKPKSTTVALTTSIEEGSGDEIETIIYNPEVTSSSPESTMVLRNTITSPPETTPKEMFGIDEGSGVAEMSTQDTRRGRSPQTETTDISSKSVKPTTRSSIEDCPSYFTYKKKETVKVFERWLTGAWMKDPQSTDSRVYVMKDNLRVDRVLEYANEAALREDSSSTVHRIPVKCMGTGHVIYNSTIYCSKYKSNVIASYNLRTKVLKEMPLPDAGFNNKYPYSIGAMTDIDFAVDEQGLWAIYSTDVNDGNVVLSKLNPNTLEIETTYETWFLKKDMSNAFMRNGTFFGLSSTSGGSSYYIKYLYDTRNGWGRILNANVLPLSKNNVDDDVMVSYNPKDSSLYAWTLTKNWDGHLVKYSTICHSSGS